MKNTIQNILKFFLFLAIGLGLLYFVYQNQNEAYQAQCALDGVEAADCSLMQKVFSDFKSVHFGWVFASFLAYLMSNFSRALRWKMMLKPLGSNTRTINAFLAIMLGLFANLGFPRIGEVIRGATLAKYEKLPVEKALGTIVVGRTIDVLSLFIIIGLAFLFEYDTLWGYLNENMAVEGKGSLLTNPFVLSIIGGGIISLVLVFIFRKQLQATKLYQKVTNIIKGFWEGILSVKNLERPGLFIFYSFLIWLGYYLMTYFYLPAFGPTAHLGFVAALMVFTFGTFGIVIPSPGGMGTFHVLAIAAFALYGVAGGDAFSAANISFFGTHFSNILFGLIAVFFLPIINKNYQPEVNSKHQDSEAQLAESKY